jgi:hypothetical protein
MVGSSGATKIHWYAGAFTGVVFLTIGYADHVELIDLRKRGFSSISFQLLVLAPFIIFIVWPFFSDFFSATRGDERDCEAWIEASFHRFLRFIGGLLLAVFPGILVLFGLIAV